MAFETQGSGALDYFPCRYGKSKLLFRGPRRRLSQPYCAAIGGTETYGKFVVDPWPKLLEARLGMPVINFGYLNAGIDVFINEPEVATASAAAKVTVIQLMGAQNMSNRYYAVHPRRNDRFLRASNLMQTVFREVDFTEFNFTRHMLSALRQRAPERFQLLAQEMRNAWIARMELLLRGMEGKVVLLWLGEYRATAARDGLGADPVMVSPEMVAAVSPLAAELVRVEPSFAARLAGTKGMYHGELDAPAASEMPGPLVHQEVSEALAPVLSRLIL
ncbi:DUF6473 family protein [Phaeovulum sp.]|uniref:DUF6473 family protein n=1 Tax=Phaeovulum sp. TaxID=2934796 RepID=UPI0039E43C9A